VKQSSNKAVVFELLDSVLTSWWTLIGGICFGAAGALVALHYIPKVYEARALIRITPPKIPQEFVRATVTDDLSKRLLTIQELVFSRDFMDVVMAKHFTLPKDETQRESQARGIRSRITIEASEIEGLFAMLYRDEDPDRTAAVVNTLTELSVTENARQRERSAMTLTETIRERAADAQSRLDAKQLELSSFQARHSAQSTDYLDYNRQSLETARREVAQNRERQGELSRQIQLLRAEEKQGRRDGAVLESLARPGTVVVDSYTEQMRKLESELKTLRTNYLDSHPTVRAKLREIEELERRGPDEAESIPNGTGTVERRRSPYAAEIEAAEAELRKLNNEEARLLRDIERHEGRIVATPSTQVQLDKLLDETNVLKEEAQELQRQLQDAESGHRLEERQQGEQLEVVEAARVPARPVEPDPIQVFVMGLAVGVVLFVAPLPVRRLLSPLVASESGLRAVSEVPVLVSIPRVPTAENRGLRRRRLIKNVGLSLLSTAALAAVTAYFGNWMSP
jgi:uncharacterized protein involved in exopolysaccharide biosynthesis